MSLDEKAAAALRQALTEQGPHAHLSLDALADLLGDDADLRLLARAAHVLGVKLRMKVRRRSDIPTCLRLDIHPHGGGWGATSTWAPLPPRST